MLHCMKVVARLDMHLKVYCRKAYFRKSLYLTFCSLVGFYDS